MSAQNLEENYEPAVLSLIKDLAAAGKSPTEIVEALEEQDFTAKESWRLLRDVEAMKLQIADGRALISRANLLYVAAIVMNVVMCFVLGYIALVLGLILAVVAGNLHSQGLKRVAQAERLIYPRSPKGHL